MTQLSNAQKRELAKLLYINEHLSQKEIATRVGVSAQTITKWVKTENWEQLRVSLTIMKEEQLKSLYRQVSAINDTISSRETEKYPTPAEADAINKLASAIAKLEVESGLSEIIASFKEFFSWLRSHNVEEAQRIIPLFDDFVKSKMR